ncbi:SGNH/GDSL hydrolase family protein [Hyalangium versicolor]|uniref:SGNH/GDSL hydrolase family protein n=1 Tax=Hyalangium versicolor TaxID=2861190 RepID=UPI001CCAA2BF|nr:GDSL-type esterase/lipase family protein [Hyalangium versicolor]
MIRSRSGLWALMCTWSLLAACGAGSPEAPSAPSSEGGEISTPAPMDPLPQTPSEQEPNPAPEEAPPPGADPEAQPPPTPPIPAPAFQPAFHQALRWSKSVSSLTTFRMRVPVGKAGERLRVTFSAGDGTLKLQKATVALAGADGALASQPVTLSFNGAPGFTASARQLVTSDPVVFPVGFRAELAISFEVSGALGVSAIDAFPGSFSRSGAYSTRMEALGGSASQKAIGVATVDVEATPGRAFVALGDSITEGYIDTYNDTRNAWPALVEKELGVPVVNAAVSGQGFWGELINLDHEVLAVQGATDCLVLLGTNDLTALSVADLEARMTTLITRLKPFCRVWVSTLLPKERTNYGTYEQVKTDRVAFNAWIRTQTMASVIDLEAVTRSPGSVHLFIDGLDVDGIHPSIQGHQVMAKEVARVLRAQGGL